MNIFNYPDPMLRQRAKPLTEINKEVYLQVEEMLELMYQAQGIGLAAPQVGWPVRLFIIDVNDDRNMEKVFINPVIIEETGELNKEEGVFEFPRCYGQGHPCSTDQGSGLHSQRSKIEIEAEDLAARAWQHEIDHLNGCLFIDKMSPANRLAISHQLKEFERSYKVPEFLCN